MQMDNKSLKYSLYETDEAIYRIIIISYHLPLSTYLPLRIAEEDTDIWMSDHNVRINI